MAIPIHQLVFDNRVPAVNRRCLASWAALQPVFAIRAWDNAALHDVIRRTHLGDLVAQARNFGEASDILRLAIVYEYGGIYTDWDIYLLDPVLFRQRFSATSEGLFLKDAQTSDPDYRAIITHSWFYAPPALPLVRTFLDQIAANYRLHPTLPTVQMTGPHAFTSYLLSRGWDLDIPPFVDQRQFFHCRFAVAAAHEDKAWLLEDARRAPHAPLLNLWTNCWIDKGLRGRLRRWLPNRFSPSRKALLAS